MSEKEKEVIRNLSEIKDDNLEKGFDSLSEIPNSSFDNKKNGSFITDHSNDTNLRVSLNTSTSKKKNTDIEKMLPLFLEKLSQNMQNVDFKLSLNKSPTNPSFNDKVLKSPEANSSSNVNNNNNTAVNTSTGFLNNQKQKDAIIMKYNNMTNNSITSNKHINSNFNVIDEIVEEDLLSRASITINQSDLDICILNGQTADQKISDKLKNKNKSINEKIKQQSFMKSTNKSSSNLNQTSKIKSYIKENKTKMSSENPFLNSNVVHTEYTTQFNETPTNRIMRTNRISPDNVLNKKENNKAEREGLSRDMKNDDRKRMVSRTPPKTIYQDRGVNKDKINATIAVNRETSNTIGNNYRKPSVSPDVKRDVKRPKPIENTINKMDRIEKIDKLIMEKENARNKKTSLNFNNGNMNIKKAIKIKEKEQQKIEETMNLKSKIKNKVIEKQRTEAKNTLHYQKDSISKTKTQRSENNLDDFPCINCDTKEFFEIICIVSELYSSSPAEIKKVLKNIVDLNKSDSDNTSNNEVIKKTLNQSVLEFDTAAQTIQRKWREYKLASLLDLPNLSKQDLFQRSKLLLLDTLMKHNEFKKILNIISQLTQLWKQFTTKKQGIKRITNTLASCEENNYVTMSESILLLLKSNRDSRVFTVESEIK